MQSQTFYNVVLYKKILGIQYYNCYKNNELKKMDIGMVRYGDGMTIFIV